MERKKILLTTGIFPPEVGGPATYSALLEKELPKFGIDVEVLPFRDVRKYPKLIRHIIFFIKALIRGYNKDLLYTQDTVSVGFPTMIASKIIGKPFLIRVPGDYAWEQSAQRFNVKDTIDDFQIKKYGVSVEILKKIQSVTVRNANMAITPSKYFKQLVGNWNKNINNVVTIYNGINFGDFKSFNNQYKTKTIVSAGRLVPWKGFDKLIELMKELPDWHLSIAGDGPEKNGLKKIISENKLEERVKLLGNIERANLFKIIQESEIFILNTSFESFSFQIVEVMHIGTPVISTNVGNITEIIEDGVSGILVTPNNKEEIMDAIKKLQDKDFRSMLIKNAKEKSKYFSIETTVKETSKVINSLINK